MTYLVVVFSSSADEMKIERVDAVCFYALDDLNFELLFILKIF